MSGSTKRTVQLVLTQYPAEMVNLNTPQGFLVKQEEAFFHMQRKPLKGTGKYK